MQDPLTWTHDDDVAAAVWIHTHPDYSVVLRHMLKNIYDQQTLKNLYDRQFTDYRREE